MRSRSCIAIAILAAGCAAPPPAPVASPAPPVVATPATPPKAAPSPPAAPAPPKVATAPAKPATPPKAPPAPANAAPPAAPARAAPPALDLPSLEQRLKATSAIGVLTKLSLKNQVDDLVARFRAFHGGQRPPTLAELRPAFDLLLMKAMSLLQDKDTGLANDIHASREAIWGVLADRDKFSKLT